MRNIIVNNYLYEQIENIVFVIDKNKFYLIINDEKISSSGYVIEKPDKWFNQKYLTLN